MQRLATYKNEENIDFYSNHYNCDITIHRCVNVNVNFNDKWADSTTDVVAL